MLLSLQEESNRGGREVEAVAAVRTSANRLDVPDDVVSSERLLELELQVVGRERGGGGQTGSLRAEAFLETNRA
jgi:hypothetical protein